MMKDLWTIIELWGDDGDVHFDLAGTIGIQTVAELAKNESYWLIGCFPDKFCLDIDRCFTMMQDYFSRHSMPKRNAYEISVDTIYRLYMLWSESIAEFGKYINQLKVVFND